MAAANGRYDSLLDGGDDAHAGLCKGGFGGRSAASMQRISAGGGSACVFSRALCSGFSLAARHAGGGSGARISAPAVSRWQTVFTACYVLTHALIVLIGLSALAMGERPRVGRAPQVLLALQALAVAAFFANRTFGTDFLFLAAPPAGTPLEGIYRLSYGVYIAFLQGMMALLALGMDAAGRRLFGGDDRPADFFAIQNSPNAV